MSINRIIELLPYREPFLFVDELINVSENGIKGSYTFDPDLPFYRGHFKDQPVTPGVILTECCAQIGLVCLGIHLTGSHPVQGIAALTSADMEFYRTVFPGDRVVVLSEKVYYRFDKLKCKVKMYDTVDQLICKGTLAGMFKSNADV